MELLILMGVIALLMLGWLPGWQREMQAQSDAQIERHDWGGCLVTTLTVGAVLLGFVVIAAAIGAAL